MPIKVTRGTCLNCGHDDHGQCSHVNGDSLQVCSCMTYDPSTSFRHFVDDNHLHAVEVIKCDICTTFLGVLTAHDINGSKVRCGSCHTNLLQMQLEFGTSKDEMELQNAEILGKL